MKHSTLEKIIKLPEKVFSEGVTTSIFIFEAGVSQNGKEIFACYIEDDGLETVKNQGRQDIKDRWQAIEDEWVEIIRKQSGNDTIQWIKPAEHLSYQMPEKEFEISDEDFTKTMMDCHGAAYLSMDWLNKGCTICANELADILIELAPPQIAEHL